MHQDALQCYTLHELQTRTSTSSTVITVRPHSYGAMPLTYYEMQYPGSGCSSYVGMTPSDTSISSTATSLSEVTSNEYHVLQDVKATTDSSSSSQAYHPTMQDENLDQTIPKKRKKAVFNGESEPDEDHSEDSKSRTTVDENKKQNHSEIEKRRRDKMNNYITELSSMIPMCHAMSRKLDKLTVLRMAVQHVRGIRGAVHSYTEGQYKPAFLSEQELKALILQAAEGFLFVIGCDRGRILFVSESVSKMINYMPAELLGQSWFDILHPKDVAKVKEQLSSSDLGPRERLIDAKTMLPVKTDIVQGTTRLSPGARRSFSCRIKTKPSQDLKEDAQAPMLTPKKKKYPSSEKKYCVVQCTGYMKRWATDAGEEFPLDIVESDADMGGVSCLVAVARVRAALPINEPPLAVHPPPPTLRRVQFQSRHATDGKFLFADQRCTLILGYLPQELHGTSMYEYYHREDVAALAEAHKSVLLACAPLQTIVYRFRRKDGVFIQLQSDWKAFKNPWTKEIEHLIAKNTVAYDTPDSTTKLETHTNADSYEYYNQPSSSSESPRDMQRMISSHVECSKIGAQIAEEVWEVQRAASSGSSPDLNSPHVTLSDVSCYAPQLTNLTEPPMIPEPVMDSDYMNFGARINGTLPTFGQVRNNVSLSSAAAHASADDDVVLEMMNTSGDDANVIVQPQEPGDGNDEAAMAVIMSLLEADAGLGGPVDFSGLPWPLP